MPKHQSMQSMQAEMKRLNAEYERNKRRMQEVNQLTPFLRLSEFSSQHYPMPYMNADDTRYYEEAQKNVRAAADSLTDFKFPSSAQQQYGIAKPSIGRVKVNLTRKPNPNVIAKPKHTVDPRIAHANYMKEQMLNAFKTNGGRSQKVRSQRRKRSRTRRH